MCGRAHLGCVAAVVLLVGSGSLVPVASARAQKPDLRVTSAVASLPAAPAGGTISVGVKVRSTGTGGARASKLGLSVVVVGSKALALKPLSSVGALRAGRSVRLRAAGVLPASVPAGSRIRIRVCADAKHQVKESSEANNCTTTKPIMVTAPTTEALVLSLVKAGKLSRGKAALLTMQAASGDPRLPAAFRAPGDGTDDHTAIADIAAIAGSLPAKDRAKLAPYFLPPQARERLTGFAPKGAHASAVCNDTRGKYIGIPAAGGKATVWYPQNGNYEAAAERFAAIVDVAWPKLTQAFREPLSDANVPCLSRGGGLSISVYPLIGKLGTTTPAGLFADPFTLENLQTFCTGTPSFIVLRPDATAFVVAHELMHAIQFAYKYKSCGGSQNAWWDEGGANWAGDFVYPNENEHQHRFNLAFTSPDKPLWTMDYDAWPFWYFLTKTTGQTTMNNVFAKLRTMTVRPAVDAAIPGGYKTQFPLYLRTLWNQSPVGSSGFPVTTAFSSWDSVADKPTAIGDTALDLGGQAQKTFRENVFAPETGKFFTPSTSNPGFGSWNTGQRSVTDTLGPEAASFRHFTFPDPKLRKLTFTNALFGKPGERIDAWMRLADGTWKVDDWSAKKTVLCRDKAAENVQELYIVSENVAVSGDGIPIKSAQHQLDAANRCPWPKTYTGTWTRVFTFTSPPGMIETVQGTAVFDRDPIFPESVEGQTSIPYRVRSASVHWEVSGSDGGCTTFSGSGTDAAVPNDPGGGGPTGMTLEDVSGKPDAPKPEPQPFYYSIRAHGDSLNPPKHDVTHSSACGGDTTQETIDVDYLGVGWPSGFDAGTPPDQIQKSADIHKLEGHRTLPDDGHGFTIDDTWSFTGSG